MLQERTRSICGVGIRGVNVPSQEALHALVVFTAWLGPWVLAASSGHLGTCRALGARAFTCSVSCSDWGLAGECSWGQLSDCPVPQLPVPTAGQLLCPACVPQVTRVSLGSELLQRKGSGWRMLPGVGVVVQLPGAGLQLAAEPQSQCGKAAAASASC